MNAAVQKLRAEIASDRAAYAEQVAILGGLSLGQGGPVGEVAQAALALHHAYTAVEAMLERIARTFEGAPAPGSDWHQALLDGMVLEIEALRPAVLSRETADLLRQLLGFRHFLRHGYRARLDGHRLAELRECAVQALARLDAELVRFDDFLKNLIRSGG